MKDASTWTLSRRLLSEYLRPYIFTLSVGLVCMVVGAACTAFLAKQMEPVIDDIFIAHNADMLYIVAFQVFLIFMIKGIAYYGQTVTMTLVGQHIVADMRKKLVDHILKLDLAFFHNTPSGELLSRFTNDVNMLDNVISKIVTSILKDGLTLFFLVSLMFYNDWLLASIAFFAFPLAVYPIARIGKRMRKSYGSIQEELAEFSILLSQMFQGARLIKSYRMEKREQKRSAHLIHKIFRLIIKATRVRSATHPIMEFLGGTAIVIVIIYGGLQVIEGTSTSGAFFSFITALLLAYEPMKHIAKFNNELQEKLAGAIRVFEVLAILPTIKDAPKAKPLQVRKGDIALKDVHFSYAKDAESALSGMSLAVPAGTKVALVGASGAGKSTIINLLPRFYDIDKGTITIDGHDIRKVTQASLRDQIAIVSQEITLFDDTVRGNIAYGRHNASEKDIISAAKAAAAHEFIIKLPNGYDTLVGEQGVKLSGGQRQRLAIARAMLKNAPILLLDEATSALDSKSEAQVQKALNTLMIGRTTLVVAHRLSTIVDADIIYLIDSGKAVAAGKHEELLESCEAYAKLCRAQFGEDSFKLAS
ncbi:MAG: ABC transporter ATP-binding protein [Alphaproteobacteria bacterium]